MIGPHTMLGPGGKLVEPRSESAVLGFVLGLLVEARSYRSDPRMLLHHVDDAIAELRKLQQQVGAGYHRNPPPGKFQAGEAVGMLGRDVHEVRYTHADNGEAYKHKFESGTVEVWAIRRGQSRDLLLTSRDGLPLWRDFEEEE